MLRHQYRQQGRRENSVAGPLQPRESTHRRLLEVDQHEVVVRAAAHELVTVGGQLLRHRRGVTDNLLRRNKSSGFEPQGMTTNAPCAKSAAPPPRMKQYPIAPPVGAQILRRMRFIPLNTLHQQGTRRGGGAVNAENRTTSCKTPSRSTEDWQQNASEGACSRAQGAHEKKKKNGHAIVVAVIIMWQRDNLKRGCIIIVVFANPGDNNPRACRCNRR